MRSPPAVDAWFASCFGLGGSMDEALTGALRDRVRHLNSRVTALPNALDERRLPAALPARQASGSKIGYFGTFTHRADLMWSAAPLRAALSRLRGRATVVLCGISPDDRVHALFEGLAPVETMPVTADYESFLEMMSQRADWDVGLAPLAAGQFESTKSDIKFLEYAAFGIPAIYSAHPTYAAVQHGITGMAAPEQWADCLPQWQTIPLCGSSSQRRLAHICWRIARSPAPFTGGQLH